MILNQVLEPVKKEAARLYYDGQILNALSKETSSEEQEIGALLDSNQQAKKNLAAWIKREFFDTYSSLEALDEEESSFLVELMTTYPDLFKGSEDALVTFLYLMVSFAKDTTFLKAVKPLLLSEVMVTAYVRSSDHFFKEHLDDVWKSLVALKIVQKKDYLLFKEEVKKA